MHDLICDENRADASGPSARRVSRRGFLGRAAALAGSTAVLARLSALAGFASAPRGPVVGFHMDRPYLDPSGAAEPYHPPCGTRSGEGMAEIATVQLLGQFGYC